MLFSEFKDICQQALLSDSDALSYVSERKLSIDAINIFGIGYCPESLRPQIRDTDLEWLIHRIIFPITDAYGDIVAFAGRALDNRKPKYINTAYSKSSHFYNLDRAKSSILNKDYVILVEGYMDTIALYMAGITNVVALCGVAFKPKRLSILARYTNNVILLLDNDPTGEKAADKVIKMFIDYGFNVKTLSAYPYKDADEIINSLDCSKFIYKIENCFKNSSNVDLSLLEQKLKDLK